MNKTQAVADLGCTEVLGRQIKAGEEAEMGEEGGSWLTVDAARSRSEAGVFLSAIVAIAAAEEAGSAAFDEAGLLKIGRSIAAAEALARFQQLAGSGGLAEICERVGEAVGLSTIGRSRS